MHFSFAHLLQIDRERPEIRKEPVHDRFDCGVVLEQDEQQCHQIEHRDAEHHAPEDRMRSNERTAREGNHRDDHEEERDHLGRRPQVVLQILVRIAGERQIEHPGDADEQQRQRVRLVEELDGDVLDRCVVDRIEFGAQQLLLYRIVRVVLLVIVQVLAERLVSGLPPVVRTAVLRIVRFAGFICIELAGGFVVIGHSLDEVAVWRREGRFSSKFFRGLRCSSKTSVRYSLEALRCSSEA